MGVRIKVLLTLFSAALMYDVDWGCVFLRMRTAMMTMTRRQAATMGRA